MKLPWKAKPRVPCERASKTILETGVKFSPAFCLGSSIEKTNSGAGITKKLPRKGVIFLFILVLDYTYFTDCTFLQCWG